MIANKKNVNNDIGKHCGLLVTDFFNFFEGRVDEVKIIDIRDIRESVPPEKDQLRKMMARCDKAWRDYCDFVGLPMMCKKLFTNRIKEEWQIRASQSVHRGKRQNADS